MTELFPGWLCLAIIAAEVIWPWARWFIKRRDIETTLTQ